MNSRERVFTALHRTGTPDRVPVQFDLCRPLLEAFSVQHGIPLHYHPSHYEDLKFRTSGNELRLAMGSDCVVVGGGLPAGYEHPRTDDGCIINEFGMELRQGLLYMDVIECPLAMVQSVEEVQNFPFPDPTDTGRFVVSHLDQSVEVEWKIALRGVSSSIADRCCTPRKVPRR
jgi:uroporphyrinogen decarboxylase